MAPYATAGGWTRCGIILALAAWALGCTTHRDVTGSYGSDYIKGGDYVLKRPAILSGSPVGTAGQEKEFPSLYVQPEGQDSPLAAGTRLRFKRLILRRLSFKDLSLNPVAEITSGPFSGNYVNLAPISAGEARVRVDPQWLELASTPPAKP